ncbi:GNAT family N-acetyltransferase [Pontibacillus marinus]|uniref:Acetyltransferase n=1 Tax=Pontibacillus marinus BH030004 = DSM 16465 TaxID=1385511 RepID=A0A0A5G8B7_9BACI|nr:GNAT family protein [Pontibacillus marinus]KGX88299.1 acetyltransferase [Pontibacillus marinus BH030004 = DSM 16465]
MMYTFQPMTQKEAEHIAGQWHYEGKYSFYDISADEEDHEEFLDPKQREGKSFSVYKNGSLIGFFSFTKPEPNVVDIGLGLRPDLTGNGEGQYFLEQGIDYVKDSFSPQKLTLSVATFNERAIKVYERVGFKKVQAFMQDTNGSTFEFVKMEYEVGE